MPVRIINRTRWHVSEILITLDSMISHNLQDRGKFYIPVNRTTQDHIRIFELYVVMRRSFCV